MQTSANQLEEIIEGSTKIIVPSASLNEKVPPRDPVFFNPRAKLNRDFSIIAYSAFWKNFKGPKIFLDGLAGIGVRALRVANEIQGVEKIFVNDANANALGLFEKAVEKNNITNYEISENEVCRFLSNFSQKDKRGSIVDIDPFGSPSKYLDCCIRATIHGGLFSCTATDLQVLHGLFNHACKRKYYGLPIKTKYANEIAIRLVLGCICFVAHRLDIEIVPFFVENELHYYRTYVQILNRPDKQENLGYILHCRTCDNRKTNKIIQKSCDICNSSFEIAGPLWIGKLFEKNFVQKMLEEVSQFSVDKKCEMVLQKCLKESEMPATYFTLDELGSRLKKPPLSLEKTIKKLQNAGYSASPTSLNPTGFRTSCKIDKISEIFLS